MSRRVSPEKTLEALVRRYRSEDVSSSSAHEPSYCDAVEMVAIDLIGRLAVLEPYQSRIDELKRCLCELADYTLCEAAGHPLYKAVRRAAHDMAGWKMPKRRE